MRKMTEEDKQKIAQQVEFFRSEKLKFDREVAKWDDTGNDIIVLAKHMCMIMMEMTDFTRYLNRNNYIFIIVLANNRINVIFLGIFNILFILFFTSIKNGIN